MENSRLAGELMFTSVQLFEPAKEDVGAGTPAGTVILTDPSLLIPPVMVTFIGVDCRSLNSPDSLNTSPLFTICG